MTVGVEQQDAGHDPEPERQHHHGEVLRPEAQRLLREAGAEDAEHADERGRDPEVHQRPEDPVVAPDEAQALAQLGERRLDGLLGLADGAAGRGVRATRAAATTGA